MLERCMRCSCFQHCRLTPSSRDGLKDAFRCRVLKPSLVSLFFLGAVVICAVTALFLKGVSCNIFTRDPKAELRQTPNQRTKVLIEILLDLVCPDSVPAWHIVKELRALYRPANVTIKILVFPLPYHRNSFVLSQGFHLLEERYPDKLVHYVDLIYEHYLDLKHTATTELSDVEVLSIISTWVETLGVDRDEFETDIDQYRSMTTERWKYAARRGVAGTPWYFLNGVELAADPDAPYNLVTWKTFIDHMLSEEQG